jgi:hypothetical protein
LAIIFEESISAAISKTFVAAVSTSSCQKYAIRVRKKLTDSGSESYQIFIKILNLREPEESRQLADCFHKFKVKLVHKVIDMETVNLNQHFELSPNKGVCILHDIIRAYRKD